MVGTTCLFSVFFITVACFHHCCLFSLLLPVFSSSKPVHSVGDMVRQFRFKIGVFCGHQ